MTTGRVTDHLGVANLRAHAVDAPADSAPLAPPGLDDPAQARPAARVRVVARTAPRGTTR
ncbi:hypothetical protein [Plantactinospora sp. BC1]|uniref:hypothetical protein n=1 Tax=Plantactinospora sp. BC1 TaxID=2108470 RepID=UPI00131F349A|nr:hypothetical protein [Plantactinospora sp. BC1]